MLAGIGPGPMTDLGAGCTEVMTGNSAIRVMPRLSALENHQRRWYASELLTNSRLRDVL